MDWFTWLSKTDLDPSVVYEYALTFTHNELGQDDVAYFSHEFLQSMGVSIALSVVPTRNHSLRWKVAMLQRNTRLRAPPAKTEWPMLGNDGPRIVSDPGILMLTNGSPSQSSGSTHSSIWVESEANAESGHITTEALANPWNSSFSRTNILSPDRDYFLLQRLRT